MTTAQRVQAAVINILNNDMHVKGLARSDESAGNCHPTLLFPWRLSAHCFGVVTRTFAVWLALGASFSAGCCFQKKK